MTDVDHGLLVERIAVETDEGAVFAGETRHHRLERIERAQADNIEHVAGVQRVANVAVSDVTVGQTPEHLLADPLLLVVKRAENLFGVFVQRAREPADLLIVGSLQREARCLCLPAPSPATTCASAHAA